MVWPQTAILRRDVADLRALPSADSELVDQAHYGENVVLLGERDAWRYVQGADQYFGWLHLDELAVFTGYMEAYVVAVLLADVRGAPRSDAQVIAHLPAGTSLPASAARGTLILNGSAALTITVIAATTAAATIARSRRSGMVIATKASGAANSRRHAAGTPAPRPMPAPTAICHAAQTTSAAPRK